MNNPAEIVWPRIAPAAELPEGVVQVWAASLALPEVQLRVLWAVLTPDERARAERFRFEVHRNRFVAGRGIVRTLLASCLGKDPSHLQFAYSPRGKPSILDANQTVHFNAAHCEDMLLVAVTRIGPVGVDVERVRQVKDMSDLVSRFFSPREDVEFQRLDPGRQPAAFFRLWTRKEAWLKATGDGIPAGLNRVEVTLDDDATAEVLSIGGDPEAAKRWSLSSLVPAPGWIGAVAVETADLRIATAAFHQG